jgi:hypothetical protein
MTTLAFGEMVGETFTASEVSRNIEILPIYEKIGIVSLGAGMNDFFAELKRRKVYKVAIAYAVGGGRLLKALRRSFRSSMFRTGSFV